MISLILINKFMQKKSVRENAVKVTKYQLLDSFLKN